MSNLPDNVDERDVTKAGQVTRPSDFDLEMAAWRLARDLCVQNVEIKDGEVMGDGDECTIVRVFMTVETTVYWSDV